MKMAYMSQEQKAKIVVELKKVIPKDWKWSVSVEHRSTIVLTISKAPVDLNAMAPHGLNEYHLDLNFSGELLETFKKIRAALNLDNFDNSDPMTDYFHVGHYVNIRIGKWNKPFIFAQ
jgi:hypothetical protein